jgi:hypothetical protein
MKFDAGRAAGANLHELTIDISELPQAQVVGDSLVATLAVANDRAYLLLGGDVATQLAAAVAAGKQPAAGSKPLMGVDLSVASLLGYAARMGERFNPEDPASEALERVAAAIADKPSTLVQLLVRPLERGGSIRLAIDAGALQALSSAVTVQSITAQQFDGALPPGVPALAP